MRQETLWRRCGAEMLGTALIVLADVGSAHLAQLGVLPLPVASFVVPGVMVMILIYLLGDVSGAHFNPAVSVAFALRGCFPWRLVPVYVAAQLLGAVAAAWVLAQLGALAGNHERVTSAGAWALETAATTLLVLVVLATAKQRAVLGPETGLVVGSTVGLAHALAGGLTAVTLNSARALGPALIRGDVFGVWPHWTGPLCGALLAVGLTWMLRGAANTEEAQAAQGHPEHQSVS